ncbi:hypothetical protein [Streptomyces sp. NBC_01236]|uniref:hypothetical protein n=1 Tax=Streptomyces sp. NBC_01236 TaxID=2903789 RepID=UPI002E15511B|nr:hypothetical protein OG324_28615 [Streptomyces sp. NBC_01236]
MRYAVDFCQPLVAQQRLTVIDGSGPLSDAGHVERIGQIPESISKGEWVGWTFSCTTCGQKFWLSGQFGRGAQWDFEKDPRACRRLLLPNVAHPDLGDDHGEARLPQARTRDE